MGGPGLSPVKAESHVNSVEPSCSHSGVGGVSYDALTWNMAVAYAGKSYTPV